MHNQFHPAQDGLADGAGKFRFNWKDRVKTGLSTKDYIAPTSFDFRDGKMFRMGEHIGAASYLQILAPELTDRMLADLLDIDAPVTVTLHIQSINQAEATKTVKASFCQVVQPQIFVKVLPTLPNQYQFANKADVGGKYGSEWVVGNSTWVTTIYAQPVKLPRTGY